MAGQDAGRLMLFGELLSVASRFAWALGIALANKCSMNSDLKSKRGLNCNERHARVSQTPHERG